jgi:hypothetical protein
VNVAINENENNSKIEVDTCFKNIANSRTPIRIKCTSSDNHIVKQNDAWVSKQKPLLINVTRTQVNIASCGKRAKVLKTLDVTKGNALVQLCSSIFLIADTPGEKK